jgi:hypothetical protein
MTTFTDAQTQEIKQRMGYGSLTQLAQPYLDTALVFEEVVQANTNDYGIMYVTTTVLPNLQALDTTMAPSSGITTRMQANSVGGGASQVTINRSELGELLRLREFWLNELASTIRIARAPVPSYGGGGAGSVSEPY